MQVMLILIELDMIELIHMGLYAGQLNRFNEQYLTFVTITVPAQKIHIQ